MLLDAHRGITTLDALRDLRAGDIKGSIAPGKNTGEWEDLK